MTSLLGVGERISKIRSIKLSKGGWTGESARSAAHKVRKSEDSERLSRSLHQVAFHEPGTPIKIRRIKLIKKCLLWKSNNSKS